MRQSIPRIAIIMASIALAMLIIVSCSDNPITTTTASQQTFTSEEINWIPWKAEYLEKLDKDALERVWVGRWIRANRGGRVGGWYTFHNMVIIPPNALPHNTFVSVEVQNSWWIFRQTGGGVEFLPDIQFNSPAVSYTHLRAHET